MGRRRKKKSWPEPVLAEVESLSHDGRGVARIDGKTVFIIGALPGEQVYFKYLAKHKDFDEGLVVEICKPSGERVEPKCEHFGVCGGCSLQHLKADQQIQHKQNILLENLQRIGQVVPENILTPITGDTWGYRRKARLGVRYVTKKQRVLVGFRERSARYLADLKHCLVIPEQVGGSLEILAELVQGLDAYQRIAQIEMAVADNVTALVFRNLDKLSAHDEARLKDYAKLSRIHIYLQEKGPESVTLLWPEQSVLQYFLPEYDISFQFEVTDFTQVNFDINKKMIALAIDLLKLNGSEKVLDLFCGLGNFTLPIAKSSQQVTGVEGSEALVQRARHNAERNGIQNVHFYASDLNDVNKDLPWLSHTYDRVLLDPPRSGAMEMLEWIAATKAKRIVYVSCHPGSLARDAGELVNRYGYHLAKAGVMDMFPHTSHVESIALFERD